MMKSLSKILLGLLPFSVLGGCSLQAGDLKLTQAQPALINAASPESLAELENAIADLLKMERVALTPSAFSRSSRLTLERKPHIDPNGDYVMGRTLELPPTVQLFIQEGICFVYYDKTDQSRRLSQTQCLAE